MSTNIIHIGLPKCGTTSLQKQTFPELAEFLGIKYLGSDEQLVRQVRTAQRFTNNSFELNNSTQGVFISDEGLQGNNPRFWVSNAEVICKYFDKTSTIFITIREPQSLLAALYYQFSIGQGTFVSEDYFFFTGPQHNATYPYCFDLSEFSYLRLIEIYRKKFDKVFVLKLEDMNNLNWISAFLKLDGNYSISAMKRHVKTTNKRMSHNGVYFLRKLNGLLNSFGLQIKNRQISDEKKIIYGQHMRLGKEKCNNKLRIFPRRFLNPYYYAKKIPGRKFELSDKTRERLPIDQLVEEYKMLNTGFIE